MTELIWKRLIDFKSKYHNGACVCNFVSLFYLFIYFIIYWNFNRIRIYAKNFKQYQPGGFTFIILMQWTSLVEPAVCDAVSRSATEVPRTNMFTLYCIRYLAKCINWCKILLN